MRPTRTNPRTPLQDLTKPYYPGDGDCKVGEQWCTDSIVHRPLGGIDQKSIHWQNRPTYQQVVEFPAHR
jgi:hypothetical protein